MSRFPVHPATLNPPPPPRCFSDHPDIPPRQALNYPTQSAQNIDKQKQCDVSDDRTASFNSKEQYKSKTREQKYGTLLRS